MEREPKFEFYVLNWDINEKKSKMWNIFNNCYVYERTCELCEAYFNNILEFDWFVKKLDKTIMYEEWSRCEYEIVVGDLMVDDVNDLEKWDCYKQAHANIKTIARHCIEVYREYLIEKDDPFKHEECEYSCNECCCECDCEDETEFEECGCCCEDDCTCDEHKLTAETIKASQTASELFENIKDIIGKEINLEDLK